LLEPHTRSTPPLYQAITFSSTVTNLGVRFDPQLTFNEHIKYICKTSFNHLQNISKLRPLLTFSDAEKLVHAFISTKLDYCNGLFTGISARNMQKLQYIQNSRLTRTHHLEILLPHSSDHQVTCFFRSRPPDFVLWGTELSAQLHLCSECTPPSNQMLLLYNVSAFL